MIRLNIEVETDADFVLNFLVPKNALEYTIKKYSGGYKIEVDFYQKEEDVRDHIISFLESIVIDSSKDWHKEQLKEGIENYKQLMEKEGLRSYGDMLGGNWQFLISLNRITEEPWL